MLTKNSKLPGNSSRMNSGKPEAPVPGAFVKPGAKLGNERISRFSQQSLRKTSRFFQR